jgi:site-specific DNA-methyltransferase (adenine-specific)
MDGMRNKIHQQDCIKGMNALPEGSVDLIFADPPFNIGYDYDVYNDELESEQYTRWSHDWIAAAYRALSPTGTFWLAIGDEYAAELKIESQKIGFHCRSWVIWYYTFGVNCSKKFSRSHAHLFHFVKDPQDFVFRDGDRENRIPSARQLVYNDKRANPKGRLPDDTWIISPADAVGELTADEEIWHPETLPAPKDEKQTWTLRPQDLAERFQPDEDTWYFPRVAGTFKERSGFHGCQMPEQLLGRIVRVCSEDKATVLDPFSGSATTLAVAKKLGRSYIGFEISADYVQHGLSRLDGVRVGDRLDGSAEPLVSAPETGVKLSQHAKAKNAKQKTNGRTRTSRHDLEEKAAEARSVAAQQELTKRGVIEAFSRTHDGFSADRVVADPDLNSAFVDICRELGIAGDARAWNVLLFGQRKAGKLAHLKTTRTTTLSWEDCDRYLFASEIALQRILDRENAASLDDILCDPALATKFDKVARRLAPKHSSFEYRWAALKLRKQAKFARSRGSILQLPKRLGKRQLISECHWGRIAETSGVYVLRDEDAKSGSRLYVGEALNLRRRLTSQFGKKPLREEWTKIAKSIQTFPTETMAGEMLAWQSRLVSKYKPPLNFRELRTKA